MFEQFSAFGYGKVGQTVCKVSKSPDKQNSRTSFVSKYFNSKVSVLLCDSRKNKGCGISAAVSHYSTCQQLLFSYIGGKS